MFNNDNEHYLLSNINTIIRFIFYYAKSQNLPFSGLPTLEESNSHTTGLFKYLSCRQNTLQIASRIIKTLSLDQLYPLTHDDRSQTKPLHQNPEFL
jgi:hypothetical protein